MPKIAPTLNSVQVNRIKHDGRPGNMISAVGGVPGLHLQITPTGGRSWILRAKVGNKRRDIGLGALSSVSLSDAREKAAELKRQIADGRDPILERKDARADLAVAQRNAMTFAEAMETYLQTKVEIGELTKHKKQWRSTLETYAVPIIGTMPLERIGIRDVLRALEPIWMSKNETATRVRQRIESVLAWATVAGHREGDNPARWKGNLDHMLPKTSEVKDITHHPAISQSDAPRWWAQLCRMEGQGARVLRFLALTAGRSGEARGLLWREIVFENGEPAFLDIPAKRMKAKRDHVVPLSAAAVLILREAVSIGEEEEWPELPRDALVFPAPRGGELSDMTVGAVMRRMQKAEEAAGRVGYIDGKENKPAVPHGLRSTFRVWAGKNSWPRELSEEALAHELGNAVEQSYAREHMAERRKPMMEAYADFLTGCNAQVCNVIEIKGRS